MRTTNENDGASLYGTAVGCQALDSDGRHVGELWVASVRDGVVSAVVGDRDGHAQREWLPSAKDVGGGGREADDLGRINVGGESGGGSEAAGERCGVDKVQAADDDGRATQRRSA